MNFKRYFYSETKQIKSEKIYPVTVIERKEYEFDESFINSLDKIKANLSKDEKLFPTDLKEQFAAYQRFKSLGADEKDEYMVKLAATMLEPEEPLLVKLSKIKLDPVVVPKVPKTQLSASGTASDEEFMTQLSATIPNPDKMKASQSSFFNASKVESEELFTAKLSETMSIISPSLLYSELLFSIDNLYMKNNESKIVTPEKPEAHTSRKVELKEWFFDFCPDNEKETKEVDLIKTTREWKDYEFDQGFLNTLAACMQKLRNDKDLFPDDPMARKIAEERFVSFGLYDEELFMAKLSKTISTIAPSLLYAEKCLSLTKGALLDDPNYGESDDEETQYYPDDDEEYQRHLTEYGEEYGEEEYEYIELSKSVQIFKHFLNTLAYVTETPEDDIFKTIKIYQPEVIPDEIEELGINITELPDTVTEEEEEEDSDFDVDYVKWVDDYNEWFDSLLELEEK